MSGDIPTILDAGHSHTIYGLGNLATPTATITGTTGMALGTSTMGGWELAGTAPQQAFLMPAPPTAKPQRAEIPSRAWLRANQEEQKVTRRLVQVFIADPDESVPLERSMLYSGSQKLTDCNDQELFFEIDIKSALESHNVYRRTLVNKKVKERTEQLEPARIRDLKMVVVTVATF